MNNGFTEFGKYEAFGYQGLGKMKLSNELIDHALDQDRNLVDKTLEFEFHILQLENLEYEQCYVKADGLGAKLWEKAMRTNVGIK